MEEWKSIKHYPNYEVSSHGRVKSLKRYRMKEDKILKQTRANHGYLTVTLWNEEGKKTHLVHRLVCEAFIGEFGELIVDHIDNNPLNNHVSNLQLTTYRHNCSKDKDAPGVSYHKNNKMWEAHIRINGKQFYLGQSKDKETARRLYINKLNQIENEC